MILGQVSYLDCIAFVVFVAPQLLLNVGLWGTITCAVFAIPNILFFIPFQFLKERYLTRHGYRSPYVQRATYFQDFVIRCVRYAFSDIPPRIGRVFFLKPVALPFLYFRMLRHGYLYSPIPWRTVDRIGLKGIWAVESEEEKPDVVLFYCHGGGFCLGTSWFYLEFLLAWISILKEKGFQNPAVFALEYTLVPEAVYPTQLQQAIAGYEYVLSIVGDPSKICLGGDSAGGSLMLSLLLYIASRDDWESKRPGFATLISPWTTLVSPKDHNTRSDFLDTANLHQYAWNYAGSRAALEDPLVSPGTCMDREWWSRAIPSGGLLVLVGSDEVLAPSIFEWFDLVKQTRRPDEMELLVEEGGIHAWPLAELFTSDTKAQRRKGLDQIGTIMWKHMRFGFQKKRAMKQ